MTTQQLPRRLAGSTRTAAVGFGLAIVLMVTAMAVPHYFRWRVRVNSFPPLHAEWMPRTGPTTVPLICLAVLAIAFGPSAAARLPWLGLLGASFASALVWLLGLAYVDGRNGIGVILDEQYEYLRTARRIDNVPVMLHEYVSRITYESPHNWPVHLAGHPPGAVLFFIALARHGLGSGFQAGMVVTIVAATTPVAVLCTLRALGAVSAARAAAPFLVFGPAAIWSAVSADAVFAAVAAWGLCLLAVGAVRRSRLVCLGSGVVLGYAVYMSYGLLLLGVLGLAVLALSGGWRVLGWVLAGALVVVAVFTAYRFYWWDAYPALHQRYYEGVGGRRPAKYWAWADLAALAFSAGPVAGSAVALSLRRVTTLVERPLRRGHTAVVSVLSASAFSCILLADASNMSKAEVERIWLPFVPWILLGCTLLPDRWIRPALAVQVGTAILVQHLLFTGW